MEQKQKVYHELDQLGIQYQIIDHPAVYTIDEMADLKVFDDKPWVVKNLFLRDANGKRHFLVVLDKDKKADLQNIRRQLGTSTLSFGSEERLIKYLNLSKGSVTPLGIINDTEQVVEVVMDRSLIGRDKIGVHPNDNTATVVLSYADISKVIEAHGNQLHIVDL